MKDARICLVTLGVADLERAAGFYEAMGWTRAEETGGVVFLQGEGIVISLFGRADLAEDAGLAGAHDMSDAPRPALSLAINLPDADEVDRLFARALAAGARATKPPEKVFWGGYAGYFADPDGHLWELAHNPFWQLSPRGHLDLLAASEAS